MLGALTMGWLVCLGFGWHAAMVYDTTPGQAAKKPIEAARSTCILIAHPLCPCTRAALKALRAVSDANPGRYTYRVVFAGPVPAEKPENLTLAEAIPGVEIVKMTAKEARERYDAQTSGQTFVFDRKGHQVFSGGITASRGSEDVRFALELFDQIQKGGRDNYPVFGCALGD